VSKLRLYFYAVLFTITLSACSLIDALPKQSDTDKIVKNNIDMSVGYLRKGNLDVALEKIQRALDADWESSDAHGMAALIYERLYEIEKADDHYQYAIEYKPKDGAVLNNYGVFLCRQKQWKKAVKNFMLAVNQPSYKTPSRAYENAGACARQIPDLKMAEKYLRVALKTEPELPLALYEMAEISFVKKKNLTVRAYLQRYQAVAPHTAQSLWLGVRAERNLGDQQAAADYAKQLQRNFPGSEEFQQLLDSNDLRAGS